MKLPNNLVRGSMIVHAGVVYVVLVVGFIPSTTTRDYIVRRGYKVFPQSELLGADVKGGATHWIRVGEKVDVYFPGVAAEIPSWLM